MTSSFRTSKSLLIPAPEGFDFWRTARSHGWCALPPFSHDPEARSLTRIASLAGGRTARWTARAQDHAIALDVEYSRNIDPPTREEILAQLNTCLRLDEDFAPFHREARRHPRYRWIAAAGAGRMLRAPTMFEDAVKMICTTNCTWEMTTLMVTNLVRNAGSPHDNESHAFPSPAAVAGLTESFLRKHVKAGYRSPYVLELAERVASGSLDIESWRSSPLPTGELFKAMRAVKGIGPYAAGNLLKLVGRYDELGLDSWVRAQYFELRRKGRKVRDATIMREYEQYGKWRGLFFWLEMTRQWHQDKFRL